ncbi:MAG: lipoprotein [Gammaproteobacteria bacterium]|nr:lipoprotein [Gammaproteobacteria bacterium]
MRQLLPLPVIFLLAACGMKGDLYEATPPAEPAVQPEPGDTDKGERKKIPSQPGPATAK